MRIFDFEMHQYRGFEHSGKLRITPLTFFVGENSAGKTSALAALNYLMRIREGSESASSINTDPFDLGSFDQIAFHSAEATKYSQQFEFTIHARVNPSSSRGMINMLLNQGEDGDDENSKFDKLVEIEFSLIFGSEFGNAELMAFRMDIEDDYIHMDLRNGMAKIVFNKDGDGESLSNETPAPVFESLRSAIRSDFRFISFILQQGFMRIKQDPEHDLSDGKGFRLERLFRAISTFLSEQPQYVFASAPTRSVPERVYSSSNVTHRSDGRAAPYTLREKKISDKAEWKRLFRNLQVFGRNTEMFSSINIKRLTSDIAGPFQVRVRIGKRSENIIDVGYGISQSIPFVTELASHPHDSFFLFQQPEVHLHPKAQAGVGTFLAEYIELHKDCNIVVETHSDFIIDRVRQAVRKKTINKNLVSVVFFEKINDGTKCYSMEMDAKGDIVDPPEGYRTFFLREQLAALGID